MINSGCIGVFQYEERDGNHPTVATHTIGAIMANMITRILFR
jgi:hypothetical protein